MATQLKHTVKPSAGDYTALADAVAGIIADHGKDLVSLDKYLDIEIDGTWSSADTAAVVFEDWTTSATCYINIYTTAAARQDAHGVAWDTGAWNLSVTDAIAFFSNVAYMRLDGLQLGTVSPTGAGKYVVQAAGTDLRISNCVLKGHNHATNTQDLLQLNGAGNGYVWNSIFYNCKALGNNNCIRTAGGGVYYLYNLTVIGGETGIWNSSGTATMKNSYLGGASYATIYGTVGLTKVATSDAYGSEVGLQGIAVSTTADATHAGFVDISAGTEDFHLKVGSPLIGTGAATNGEGAPLNFTTDIDGDSRV